MKRAILIVLDGVGIGELPDAGLYGDEGANTLSHVIAAAGASLPNLAALGLGLVPGVRGIPAPVGAAGACFGRMAEKSAGKDSTAGHFELAGLIVNEPFPTYPRGFPEEVIRSFEERIGQKILGNVAASGTEIIARLGVEHIETGRPIVYTSADSVFQVAAHEEVIPPKKLYEICKEAREILAGENAVARVIARPFTGAPGRFARTAGRRDFSLPPPGETLLSRAAAAGMEVAAVGKIYDLYAGRDITAHLSSPGNTRTIELVRKEIAARGRAVKEGDAARGALILANLVDFDMLYGHRNDPAGFARALEEFDAALPSLSRELEEGDLMILTADHGNDPTAPGTDHTREYVPLLALGPSFARGRDLGTRKTFADAGATLAEHFGLPPLEAGTSFLGEILP